MCYKSVPLCLAFVASTITTFASANTFQSEIALSVERSTLTFEFGINETSASTEFSFNSLSANGAWFFQPVETTGYPLAEAAYLQRISNLNLSYEDGEGDIRLLSGDLNYYLPGSSLFLGGRVSRAEYESDPDFGQYTENRWRVIAGIAPLDGLLISTWHGNSLSDNPALPSIYRFLSPKISSYVPNIKVQHVQQLDLGRALRLGLSYTHSLNEVRDYDDGTSLETSADAFSLLEGDFYLNPNWSLGALIIHSESTSFGVRTRKFVTPNISLDFSALKGDDFENLSARASFRF